MSSTKSTKKAPVKKKSTAKKAGSKKKTGASGVAKSKQAATAPKPEPESKSEPKAESKDGFSSLKVNRGQIIGLQPRVSSSFRQPDFLEARRTLRDESYASAAEAARAVAEKARELTREAGRPAPRFKTKRA